MPFEVTPGWLPFHPSPSKPRFVPPPGAVDAHCHVFGPGDRFPYAPERKYTPCDASKEQLFALRDYLGFTRNVIVQATCHGSDNRALVDALDASGGRARGVATVGQDVTDEELQALHAAGVRGTRFNFVKRLVDFTPREVLMEIAARRRAARLARGGVFRGADLPELWDFFTALPTTVVVDHMGRPDVSQPVDGPEFERFVRLMRDHDEHLVQGLLPRAADRGRAAGARRRAARLPRRGAVCTAAGGDVSRPCAVGHRLAAPEPEGPHAG